LALTTGLFLNLPMTGLIMCGGLLTTQYLGLCASLGFLLRTTLGLDLGSPGIGLLLGSLTRHLDPLGHRHAGRVLLLDLVGYLVSIKTDPPIHLVSIASTIAVALDRVLLPLSILRDRPQDQRAYEDQKDDDGL